uniref:Uncharacterized protein n=1 Tax=Anopheles atroparvus TaxID=41427 RepID=A0A182J774_ANOAO
MMQSTLLRRMQPPTHLVERERQHKHKQHQPSSVAIAKQQEEEAEEEEGRLSPGRRKSGAGSMAPSTVSRWPHRLLHTAFLVVLLSQVSIASATFKCEGTRCLHQVHLALILRLLFFCSNLLLNLC